MNFILIFYLLFILAFIYIGYILFLLVKHRSEQKKLKESYDFVDLIKKHAEEVEEELKGNKSEEDSEVEQENE